MKDKEKQIEEMANDLEEEFVLCGTLSNCGTKKCSRCFSKYLYEQGYRKLSEDSVVLSREEYEKIAQSFAKELLLQTERTTKEVVEKFISEIEFHGIATMDGVGLEYFKISSLGLREIAREQFDVEVDI